MRSRIMGSLAATTSAVTALGFGVFIGSSAGSTAAQWSDSYTTTGTITALDLGRCAPKFAGVSDWNFVTLVPGDGPATLDLGDSTHHNFVVVDRSNATVTGSPQGDVFILKSPAANVTLDAGAGDDCVLYEPDNAKTFSGTIEGGSGNDLIIADASVNAGGKSVDVSGGQGDDHIVIAGDVEGTVNGGDGNDAITIDGNAQGSGDVRGGNGDDEITVGGDAQGSAKVLGDSGADTVTVGCVSGGADVSAGADDGDVTKAQKCHGKPSAAPLLRTTALLPVGPAVDGVPTEPSTQPPGGAAGSDGSSDPSAPAGTGTDAQPPATGEPPSSAVPAPDPTATETTQPEVTQ